MKHHSWLLVANASKARVFKVKKVGVLTELQSFIAPAQHLKESVIAYPPFSEEGKRFYKHSKMHFHEKQALIFAKMIDHYLDKEHEIKNFEHLYIVAPQHFLGLLRRFLSHNLVSSLSGTCTKDLVFEKTTQLWKHLSFTI